jgi:hypothetical protein
MNEDNYTLELTPDEHYLLIQALVLLSDTCTTFCKDQDPLIDKIRIEITNAWAKRFQKEDINNIKELLQPEHIPDIRNMVEPVAWMQDDIELYVREEKDIVRGYVIPLYTAPLPKREPLSDAEVLKIATKVCLEDMGVEMNPKDFKDTGVFELSRAIEKAHGIGGGE